MMKYFLQLKNIDKEFNVFYKYLLIFLFNFIYLKIKI